MVCQNCKKEIGQRKNCNYCGFDPRKDSRAGAGGNTAPKLPPVRIEKVSSTNGSAVTALILALVAPIIPFVTTICLPLSMIFSAIGLKRAKYCNSGRGMSIASLMINLVHALVWAGFIGMYVLLILDAAGVMPIGLINSMQS